MLWCADMVCWMFRHVFVPRKKSERDDGVEPRPHPYKKWRENLRITIGKVFGMFRIVGASVSCSSVVVWVLNCIFKIIIFYLNTPFVASLYSLYLFTSINLKHPWNRYPTPNFVNWMSIILNMMRSATTASRIWKSLQKKTNQVHAFTNPNRKSNAKALSKPILGKRKSEDIWTEFASARKAARILSKQEGKKFGQASQKKIFAHKY